MKENELRNGLELLLTGQLFLEISDTYKLSGLLKKRGNLFIKDLESSIKNTYENTYSKNPEFTLNSLNIKQRMISQIAQMNEADAILASEFLDKFGKNIEVARKKGVVFFDKLL
jgi:hypothetical protein